MKRLKYISWVCFAAMLLIGCEDEYVYNTRTVNAIEILGTNEDGGLLFSKGESGEVKIKMLPVDATDKSAYSFSFESSNEEVFTVDSVGVINTVSPGEAVLSVRSVNNANVSLSCSVVVPLWQSYRFQGKDQARCRQQGILQANRVQLISVGKWQNAPRYILLLIQTKRLFFAAIQCHSGYCQRSFYTYPQHYENSDCLCKYHFRERICCFLYVGRCSV